MIEKLKLNMNGRLRFLFIILTIILLVLPIFSSIAFAAEDAVRCEHTTITDGICTACNAYGYCGAEGNVENVIWAFDESTGTLTISGSGAMADYTEVQDADGTWRSNSPWIVYADEITSLKITENVTYIGEHAFYPCRKLTEATINSPVSIIGKYAFADCEEMKNIALPDTLETIQFGAFFHVGLVSVELPNGVKTIEEQAFSTCTNMETLIIPASIESIGWAAFVSCSKLKTVHYLGEVEPTGIDAAAFQEEVTAAFYVPCTYSGTTFGGRTVTTFHDLDETTGICTYCLGYCGATGNEDKVIWAFDESTGTLTISGSDAMADYTDYRQPSGVWTSDAPWCVYYDQVTSLVITGNVTVIGNMAFAAMMQISSVTIDSPVEEIKEMAFMSCEKVTEINLPDTLKTIGASAFAYTGLTSVEIPNGVSTLGNGVFDTCESLGTVIIPASVQNIGSGVFLTCKNLNTIHFLGETEPTEISGNPFSTAWIPTIYVPCTYSDTDFGGQPVINGHFEAGTGKSNLSYTAQGNVITQKCSVCGDCGTATITGTDDLVYNGTDHASKISVTYSEGWLGNKSKVTVSPAAVINAGSYTASVSCEGETATKTFTVAQKPLTVTAKDQTITYGGSIATGVAQISGDLAVGDSFTEVTLTPSTAIVTAKGIITPSAVKIVNASGMDVTANYDITYVSGNLTINKSAPVIMFSADYNPSKIYDGIALENPTGEQITVSGAYDGDIIFTWYKESVTEDNELSATPMDVGTYVLVASIIETGNNLATSAEHQIVIKITPFDVENAENVAVTVTGTYSYTGKEIIPSVDEVTVKLGDKTLTHGTDYTFVASSNIDVGTDTAIVTVTFTGNYTGTATGKFTIAECPHNEFKDKKCIQCGGVCGDVVVHDYNNGICVNGCYQPAKLVDGVYQISNAGQLYWFAGLVNGTLTDITQDRFANAVLTADITMPEKKQWTPIGNDDSRFEGVFDGQNHTISGLYFNDIEAKYVGLIGAMQKNSAAVRNVGVLNVNFQAYSGVGGICGATYTRCTIENCYVNGSISGTNDLGGIVGAVGSDIKISNCYSVGNITGESYTGAIAGSVNRATFTNCYYLSDNETDSLDGTTAKTSAQFASGEVAYLLNGTNAGTDAGAWKQIIGTDSYPTFTGNTVYQVTDCKGGSSAYSNDSTATGVHNYVNGTCTICGDTTDVASVTITWTEMSFTYSKGEWDIETMTWQNGGWTADEGCGTVTIENTGTLEIEVEITATINEAYSPITASLSESKFSLAASASKEVTVSLANEPADYIEAGTTIGTITITLSTVEQTE